MTSAAETEQVYAVVCLKTGVLRELLEGPLASAHAEDLAAAAHELFCGDRGEKLGELFRRLGSARSGDGFDEVVLLSATGAYVVQRLRSDPDLALLAIGSGRGKLGLILSAARSHVQALEARA